MPSDDFVAKYGPWALVAGGSDGLGAAWTEAFAKRGLNVAIVGRRKELVEAKAKEIENRHGVSTLSIVLDLSESSAPNELVERVTGIDLGLVVYNAALSPGGKFEKVEGSTIRSAISTNVATPTLLIHQLIPKLLSRKNAGVILVSSLAGYAGSSSLSTYGATKAYLRMLGEALWEENRGSGLDILVTSPGAVTTPGLESRSDKKIPGQLGPTEIVEMSLAHLGKGPTFVPGGLNQFAAMLLGRILPRKAATSLMRKSSSGISS
ncbi:MAG: SDR family NAD(P)-dependent oxidoreductase [Actinomycetota bacterium]|nr:SDR family NAD(P)-dependent oxidoreductase [Actinomycetota bacterium]